MLSKLEQQTKEADKFKKEIRHMESERVRLSLIENIVKEIIALLRKLKELVSST